MTLSSDPKQASASDLASGVGADADPGGSITRRDAIKGVAAGGAMLTLGTTLAACGSSSSSASSVTTGSGGGSPKRGGTLRVGMTGGGSTDTLDPNSWLTNVDGARVWQLFDGLVTFDKNARAVLLLAEEITPNGDATEWTIRVRKGVTFHNGKDLTADDVLFTFQRILNPAKPLEGSPNLTALDIKQAKKLDALTVRIPCHTPFAPLINVLACYSYLIVPVGFDVKKPVGTGPFKFKSFTPGQQSIFTRNENYWQPGLPYVDQIVITNYSDETSQVNALLGGQADLVNAHRMPRSTA